MHVRCPHCHSAIEVAGDDDLSDVTCPSCGSTFNLLPPTAAYTPSSRTLGHFLLLEQLGAGGFGTVWKAKDTQLDRLVALKIPRRDQIDPAHAEMFLREARAAAQLRHPHIVAVHEVGRDDGTLYIVSDFVQGATLADRLTAGPVGTAEAARLCAQIAAALHHAHQAGVIHRDLKPSNVMLDGDGAPHLMDFGLAKREAGEVTLTMDGKVLGTPAYMSPEQARGEGHQADRRTDIYSLGVILFELLTGEKPFRGNPRMLQHQVIHDEPPSPRKLRGQLPRELETICLKCLEKDPGRRYATAALLEKDLTAFLAGEPIEARPVQMVERVWRWYRRSASAAQVLAGGLTVANGFVMTCWGLIGVTFFVIGIHPVEHRWLAAAELALVIVILYLPWILIGIRTLNGSRWALWIGTTVSGITMVTCALMVAGIGPLLQLQSFQAARSDIYIRVQLSSLLACIAGGLLVAHLMAIAAAWQKRPDDLSH